MLDTLTRRTDENRNSIEKIVNGLQLAKDYFRPDAIRASSGRDERANKIRMRVVWTEPSDFTWIVEQ